MYKLVRDLTTNNNCLFVLDTMTDRYTWFRPKDIKPSSLRACIEVGNKLSTYTNSNTSGKFIIGCIRGMMPLYSDGELVYIGDFETFAELTNFIVKFRTLLELEK